MLDRILIGSSAEPSDPNFKNVTLLLHGDGSNGAQNNTFIDSSSNNFTITRNGNTTQGSFSPYGSNWSNYFDGSGDYLTAPDNAALQLGSSDFTIEFWVNFSVVPGASQGATLVSKFNTSNIGYEVILYNNTMYFQAQSASIGITYAWTPTAGRWYHIAWTRSGSNSYGFIDGALVASTSGASGSITNLAQALQLGRRGDNTFYLNGYLSNVRVVKGTAVYTSAFTPPTQPLTAITNTSLLTCAYNRFRDGSTNNFTITSNGDVKVTNFAPFAPSVEYSTTTNGGSAYFDGTGDYLNTSSSFTLSSGTDFTLEFWLYPFATFSSNRALVETVGARFGLITEAGSIYFLSGSTEFDTNTNPISGAWNHIALTRTSGTIRIFLNGVQIGTASSNTDSFTSLPLWIGNDANSQVIPQCYMSDIRWATTSFYSSAFTPPTAPLTAASGTQLLVGCKNAAIFDNSMKNDLETVGNAQISTSVKKFGTGSMAFDGSGDYLIAPSSDLYGYGTGDFTIEFWLYISSVPVAATVFSNLSSAFGTSPHIYLMIDSTLRYYTSSTDRITSGTLSTGQWMHVALCRASGSTRLFINGTQSGSTYTDSNNYGASNPLGIGTYWNGTPVTTNTLNGYLDDVRVTKGVARYTANFTAPTAPFPNK